MSREELIAVFDAHTDNTGSTDLRVFLRKIQKNLGLSADDGFEALFDMMESDDDGALSWDEFEKFFLSVGWASSSGVGGTSVVAQTGASTALSLSLSVASQAGGLNGTQRPQKMDVTYVVEQVKDS